MTRHYSYADPPPKRENTTPHLGLVVIIGATANSPAKAQYTADLIHICFLFCICSYKSVVPHNFASGTCSSMMQALLSREISQTKKS